MTASLARIVDNLRGLLAAGALAVALAACGSSQPTPTSTSPTSSASSAAASLATSGGPPSSSPSPAPTLTQAQVKAAAAKAYLAAAKKGNAAFVALNKKYAKSSSLASGRAYYKAAAKIDAIFLKELRAIVFPADTAADAHALIARASAVQALDLEGSRARSYAALNSVTDALAKANRAQTAAANLLRGDLGLGPI